MRNDRRTFLAGWLAVAGAPVLARAAQQDQFPNQTNPNSPGRSTPSRPGPNAPITPGSFPGDAPEIDSNGDPGPTPNPRAVLQQDRKDLQKNAATLVVMADDLKKQVDSLDTTQVLSLDLVHKAEAIEKLAHNMKLLMQER